MTTSSFQLGRFSVVSPDALPPDQAAARQAIIDGPRGRIPTPFNIWLSSPEFARRMTEMSVCLLIDSKFTPREREIAILISARHFRSRYMMDAHRKHAAKAGHDAEVIAALCEGRRPDLPEKRELLVARLTEAMLAGGDVAEDLYHEAQEGLGHAALSDLTGLLGHYCTVATTLNLYAVQPGAKGE
jgi:4-carboxymuconolactone decarboxylase